METGPRNLITDVAGLRVGSAEDERLRSGVTVVMFDGPTEAAVDVRGGAPGTRETDLLGLDNTVEHVDALVLSGGSVFGLDAAGGVLAALRRAGRGYPVGEARVPIVPAAILFDLTNGGDKEWGTHAPYRELGLAAAEAADETPRLGSAGAGYGARLGKRMRGGLGSASAVEARSGATVGALAAVNAFGSATIGDGPQFWAAPYEIGDEFGGLGWPQRVDPAALTPPVASGIQENTTLAVVATDARLTKPQARRLAIMAQAGLARALTPAHTPYDGDLVFAAATGRRELDDPLADLARLGAVAALTLARAVARGVHVAASTKDLDGMPPAWRDLHG